MDQAAVSDAGLSRMIPSNAFLRRLPTILNGAEAIQIEALVFSADAIEVSFGAIRAITSQHRERIVDVDRAVHVELFIRAWTIVDCLHVTRQTLRAIDYGTPLATKFLDQYECASKLRNQMDHISGNAKNVANAKGRPPIFGALSYVCLRGEDVAVFDGQVSVSGGGMVTITAGRFPGGQRLSLVNPAGREMRGPVGMFRLEAFNEMLELEHAADDLRSLMAEVNGKLETRMLEQARKISDEKGIPLDRVMANPIGSVAVFLAFQTDGKN
ncbi:MAG: hypothetical protein K2Y27_23250 [Xanthobacteraceae bacterium]|nr:hypothetical protein [Xanthobacteraceae bacterium]